jgi:hypothetical protein
VSIDRQLHSPIAVRTPTIGDGRRTIGSADMFLQCCSDIGRRPLRVFFFVVLLFRPRQCITCGYHRLQAVDFSSFSLIEKPTVLPLPSPLTVRGIQMTRLLCSPNRAYASSNAGKQYHARDKSRCAAKREISPRPMQFDKQVKQIPSQKIF